METIEIRLQAIEKQSQDMNQTSQQGDVDTLESLKMKDMMKELEEKVNNNLTLNSVEGKLDIKPIKEEMKKLIELDHERKKKGLEPYNIRFERGGRRGYFSHNPERIIQ